MTEDMSGFGMRWQITRGGPHGGAWAVLVTLVGLVGASGLAGCGRGEAGPDEPPAFLEAVRAAQDLEVPVRLHLMTVSAAKRDYFVAVADCDEPKALAAPQVRVACRHLLRASQEYYRGRVRAYLAGPAGGAGARSSGDAAASGTSGALHDVWNLMETALMLGKAEREEARGLFDRVAARDYPGALSWCATVHDRLPGTLAGRCTALPQKAHDVNRKAVLAAQQGPPKDHFSICYELKRTADLLGGAHPVEAARLCAELDLRAYVEAALPAVELYLAQNKPKNLALECMPPYIDSKFRLDEMTSPFAKAQKARLFHACYSRLGVLVLDYLIPRTKGECEFTVLMVYRAVTRYGLTDPELAGRIGLVEKPCARSVELHREYL